MKKSLLFIIPGFLLLNMLSAQTLLTYDKYAVDAKDFLRAYDKNNTPGVTDKAKSIREYLDLYIKSKLKIQEAYERRYDTLPQIKMEVSNLRIQIAENYMSDPETVKKMTDEAFQRSQKDIHVAHIFISFKNPSGIIDTAAAQKKKDKVLEQLQKGEDYLKVAQLYSDDPVIKNNKGDIGYITVFTLPYAFENIIYATPIGKYSSVVTSKIGYHIFKNLGERKAAGKLKAQQILLAIPPGADEAGKKQVATLADSLYKRIIAGDNFNRLAAAFSNDYISGAAGGQMPDISVGQYDPVFESVIWSLAKDGAVSKPFLTSHGWHIVKRISLKPVVTDPNERINRQELEQKIKTDSRWEYSRDFIYNQVKNKAGFKKFPYDDAALWNMTDSVLEQKPMNLGWAITATTPLFSIGDSIYNANHWVNYANTYRFKQDGSGPKPHPQVREEWYQFTMVEYYKDHLEDLSDEFRYQMNEFKEGNLFFEIMQQEIWNRAQNDSTALVELFEKNKKSYLWNQSADAVIFFCSDETVAKTVYEQVKKNPKDWRKIAEMYTEKVVVDSSKFEWDQIPGLNKAVPKAGMMIAPTINKTDNTASFAFIVNDYPKPMQRTFNEARGMVINDYQDILEKQWNETLLKKYPVVIDERVLAEISK
jgi:peptidyl-prolyl cis-trans isomerase SurA